MSIETLCWAWQQQLDPVDKLLLLAISDSGDPGGDGPPPSTHTAPDVLAEMCCLEPDDVRARVLALRDRGFVEVGGRWWDGML